MPTIRFIAPPSAHTIALLPLRVRVFTVLYLLSGAAALLYEVAWLRLLTMSTGHTTAAVGSVLAAFMGGLAIGAWAGGRISNGLPAVRALRIYAALEATIALFAVSNTPRRLDRPHRGACCRYGSQLPGWRRRRRQ
jgi:predicted MFS family arabinose efflux permease